MKLKFALLGALLLAGGAAFAQTAPAPVVAPTWFDSYVLPVIGTIVTAIVGWFAAVASKKFNIDIEARHREAFQSALTNGAALIARNGINFAVNYVMSRVPDAIKKFSLTPEQVRVSLLARAELQQGAVPSMPVSAPPQGT